MQVPVNKARQRPLWCGATSIQWHLVSNGQLRSKMRCAYNYSRNSIWYARQMYVYLMIMFKNWSCNNTVKESVWKKNGKGWFCRMDDSYVGVFGRIKIRRMWLNLAENHMKCAQIWKLRATHTWGMDVCSKLFY